MSILRHGILSQGGIVHTIVYDYQGTPTTLIDTGDRVEKWDDLVFTGRNSPVVFSITIDYTITIVASGVCTGEIEYRKNSGSWVNLVNSSSSTSGSVSITNIDYDDTIDIRLNAEAALSGDSCSVNATLDDGSITGGGTGTVTASGTTTFSILAEGIPV